MGGEQRKEAAKALGIAGRLWLNGGNVVTGRFWNAKRDSKGNFYAGVELLVDPAFKTVQFFSIVSFKKGNGRKMAAAVVEATPDDWLLAVVQDWSGGFWEKMKEEHPRIMIF